MISHAENALTNDSMTALSITDLIQLSQGVQHGSSTSNYEINSDIECTESSESDTEEQIVHNESELEEGEVEGPALQIVWRFERLFANQKELDDFLKAENCWTAGPKHHQKKGFKIWYRCNRVKKRGLQCSAGIATVENFEPDNPAIKLFKKNLDHNCEHSLNKVTKIPDEIRDLIIKKTSDGDTLSAILYTLAEMHEINQPTKNQVINIIDTYKKKKHGDPNITLTELEKFANDFKDVPENDDTTFIVNFERSEPQSDEKWFRIFYSTKRLLRIASQSKRVHADGTYKMTIQGFPVLAVGVSDMARHFHLGGMAICHGETADDYKFLFESLKIGIELICKAYFDPEYIIADASKAITKGAVDTFGILFERINCFAHLMMNVDKRKYRSNENKENIKKDIRKLRFAYNKRIFEVGCKLFLEKWKILEPEFTMNFQNVYIENNEKWYAGSVYQAPLTNNCLEGFNRSFKLHQTYYKRQNLSVFKDSMLKFVHQRSLEYVNHRTPYQELLVIDDDLLLLGWEYASSQKIITSEKNEFFLYAGDNMEILTMADVKLFEQITYDSFDEYVQTAFSIHKITYEEKGIEWKNSRCTCAFYTLNYKCKHIVGIAFRLGLLAKPDSILVQAEQPIASKTPRGRPRKARPALVRD